MVITQEDKTPRKLELVDGQIEIIIDELERMPYNAFTFLNCDEIIKELRKAQGRDEK